MSNATEAAVAAAIIQYVHDQKTFKDNFFVAAVALLIYDYILTLHLEIRHIWSSAWTYTKVAFLLVRYMPFVFSILLLNAQVIPDVSLEVCRHTLPPSVWLLQLTMMLSETILAIRTWAIWRRNQIIGIGLGLITTTFIAVGCFLTNRFVKDLGYVAGPYPGFRGCLLLGDIKTVLLQDYSLVAAAQAIVLTLVAISAFRSYRSGDNNVLSHVIHRDGILFYVYLLCISLGNVIVIATVTPDIMTSLAPMEGIMYSVFIGRTILNIRSVAHSSGRSGTNTELHRGYEIAPKPVISLSSMNSDKYYP